MKYVSGRDQSNLRERLEVFNNTKTFLCEAGIVHWGNRPRIVNFESWDNGLLAKLFGSASIQSTLVAAESPNTLRSIKVDPLVESWVDAARPLTYHQLGFQFYDTWTQTILNDVVFGNFRHSPNAGARKADDNCALLSMTHSNEYTPQQVNTVAGLHFANVDDRTRLCINDEGTLSSRNFNVVDHDGSLSGVVGAGMPPGPRLVASGHTDAWRFSSQCVDHEAWGALVCPLQAPQGIASIKTVPDQGVSVTMYGLDNTVLGENHFSTADFISAAQMTGPSGSGWHYAFPDGVPSTVQVHAMQVPTASFVLMSFTLPPGVSCSIVGSAWSKASSLSALLESPAASYFVHHRAEHVLRTHPPLGLRCLRSLGPLGAQHHLVGHQPHRRLYHRHRLRQHQRRLQNAHLTAPDALAGRARCKPSPSQRFRQGPKTP